MSARKSNGRPKRPMMPSVQQDKSLFANDDSEESDDEDEIVVTSTKRSRSSNKSRAKVAANGTPPPNSGSLLDAPIMNKFTSQTPSTCNTTASASSHTTSPSSLSDSNMDDSSENQSQQVDRTDYQLSVSAQSQDVVLRSVVSTVLFRKVKFLDIDTYKTFTLEPKTVCHLLVKACNVMPGQEEQWWSNVKESLCRLLTDHRNNVVKSIHQRFAGM